MTRSGSSGSAPSPASAPGSGRGPRPPRRITLSSLENGALFYLQRFASSSANLKRVLERRVARAAKVRDDVDADQARVWIDDIVRRFERSGLLDDQAFARARAITLMRQGLSRRAIDARLRQKGVKADAIAAALDHLATEAGDPDLAAACRLVRRRRLGPLRPVADQEGRRQRDLASLARAGFSAAVALRVLAATTVEALEVLEAEASQQA
ncbi:MAG: RecX family transcriptional regulator [Alphaproteobacteria bacterium]